MKKWLWLLPVYLLALLIWMPAQVLYWLPLPTTVSLAQLQGSLWQGQVGQLQLQPQPGQRIVLNNVQWNWHWSDVLLGQLTMDVSIPADNNLLAAEAQLSATASTISLQDVNASGELGSLLKVANVNLPLRTEGRWTLNIQDYTVSDPSPSRWCTTLKGQADGMAIRVWVNGRWQSLGDFPLQLGCASDSGKISLAMRGENNLGLNFDGQINSQDIAISGTVKPTPRTPAGLAEMFRYLGQPDSQGRYRFRL